MQQKTEHEAEAADEVESRVEMDLRRIVPHLLNLNEDPLLTGAICHFLADNSVTRFGSRSSTGTTSTDHQLEAQTSTAGVYIVLHIY